jgi:hypothetical protein
LVTRDFLPGNFLPPFNKSWTHVTFDYDLVKGSGRLNDSQVGFDHQIAAIRQSVEGGTPLECR